MAIEEELLNQLRMQTDILRNMSGARSGSSSSAGSGISFDDVESASKDLKKSFEYGKVFIIFPCLGKK